MSSYRIWFKVDGFDEIELPVNPQEVTITYPGNVSNYDVEGIGEIVVPRINKLATVSFESFFPRERIYQTVINSDRWYSPEWYVAFFRNIQKSKQPFELTIVRGYDDYKEYDENGDYTISRSDYFDTVFNKAILIDISITDKGGEVGDVYYNMSISEYRDATPKTLAELESEEVDDNGEILNQKMVLAINRPMQTGTITVGRTVNISGEVYQTPEETSDQWKSTQQKANQIDRVVTRVLPPVASGLLHSVYVSGLGWIDKGNCKLGELAGTVNGINNLVTNKYE